MDPRLAFLLLFVAALAFGIMQAIRAAKERREALAKLATELGFRFVPEVDESVSPRLGAFTPFSSGKRRSGYNSLHGRVEVRAKVLDIQMGDYRYTTESGSGKNRSSTTHHISYVAARLPFSVPVKMAVRPEGWFDKVAAAIGFDDIDFESNEFSAKYHVKGTDKKVVYDLLDPRMIEWYVGSDAPTLQIAGTLLVLTRRGHWKPEEFRPALHWLREFVSRWPEHLEARLRAQPGHVQDEA